MALRQAHLAGLRSPLCRSFQTQHAAPGITGQGQLQPYVATAALLVLQQAGARGDSTHPPPADKANNEAI